MFSLSLLSLRVSAIMSIKSFIVCADALLKDNFPEQHLSNMPNYGHAGCAQLISTPRFKRIFTESRNIGMTED